MSPNKQKALTGHAENQHFIRALFMYILFRFFPLSQAPYFLMNFFDCGTLWLVLFSNQGNMAYLGNKEQRRRWLTLLLKIYRYQLLRILLFACWAGDFFPQKLTLYFYSRGLLSVAFTFLSRFPLNEFSVENRLYMYNPEIAF